jgi:hypothetical protein
MCFEMEQHFFRKHPEIVTRANRAPKAGPVRQLVLI